MKIIDDFIRGNTRIRVISNHARPTEIPPAWRPVLRNCEMLVAIPDAHMYFNDSTLDNFKYGALALLSFLEYLAELKEEFAAAGATLRIYQLGDLYEQRFPRPATRSPNITPAEITMSSPLYGEIINAMNSIRTHFIYGNHDFELRHFPGFRFAALEGKVYLEHGFTPDPWSTFANPNERLWEPANLILKKIREVEKFFGEILVDAGLIAKDDHFAFGVISGEEDRPDYPDETKYLKRQYDYYTQRLKSKPDQQDIRISVIGHTHHPFLDATVGGGEYIFVDAGAWTSGRSDFMVITNEELAICQYRRRA